ncbi:MAG TPA: ABC transporter permease [Candidatus Deferrimicrobium sp.]|nr:ABC transporter permease [Candidatus Deferrimicrobium sp.]
MIDAGTSVTGISLLLSETPPVTPEVGAVLAEIRWALLLVPLATVMAGSGLFLRLSGRTDRRWVIRLVPMGGLVGFAYFAMYLIHDRQTPLLLMQYTGVGFWVACFASGILFLQHFAARSTASALASPAHAGLADRMRRTIGTLLAGPRANQVVSSIFRFQSLFGLFIVIVLAIAISPSRDDSILFLNQRNLSNVARDVSETGILAVGMLLVIIIGGIDLSVGSVVALAATGGAYLLMRDLVPAYAAISIILALGLFIGWWNGYISERFRVPSFITTLAMMSIARGLAVIWSSRIAVPLSYGEGGADPMFEMIGYRIEGVIPVPAIIMVGVAVTMALILRYSAFGRYLYAIGGNQTAARLSGVAVTRIKIAAFMLCSLFAALAGIVHAAQLDQGSPNEAVGYELNAIAAVVIGGASLSGGKGTIAGAIAGALILSIINNMLSLNNVDSAAQLVIKGLIVVGAVALQQLRPRGAEA